MGYSSSKGANVGAASSCPQGKGICTIHRREKGITLIALIVTIIVLLILAMTTVSLVLRENLIKKAQLAKNEYEQAAQTESDQLNKLENTTNSIIGGDNPPDDEQSNNKLKFGKLYGGDIFREFNEDVAYDNLDAAGYVDHSEGLGKLIQDETEITVLQIIFSKINNEVVMYIFDGDDSTFPNRYKVSYGYDEEKKCDYIEAVELKGSPYYVTDGGNTLTNSL